MAIDAPRSVILTYDQDSQRLNVQLVEPAELAPILVGKFTVPILLDEYEFTLDDEFARRLGVAMLNAVALGQPEIKRYMTEITEHSIDKPSEE